MLRAKKEMPDTFQNYTKPLLYISWDALYFYIFLEQKFVYSILLDDSPHLRSSSVLEAEWLALGRGFLCPKTVNTNIEK